MANTHRLRRAMMRRRVIGVAGASEIGTDGEGERQPAEERARLGWHVRGGTAAARQLFVLAVRELHGGEPVAPGPTIEGGGGLSVGGPFVGDRARRARGWGVPDAPLE